MNILLTGINGFVGSNLSEHLFRQGHRLTGISRNTTDSKHVFDTIHTWDELNGLQLSADVWIHLAGIAHDTGNTVDEAEYEFVNVNLTERIFTGFRNDPHSGTFIFFSSVKAVASSVDNVLYEDDKFDVHTFYGRTKKAAENILLNAELPENKKIIILRPCMIHGPGNKGNLNLLYGMIKRGVPYPLGAYKNRRSFLTLENLIFVIDEIIGNSQFPGGVYNVADDEPLSTVEVVRIITDACNKKERILNVPRGFIKSIAFLGDFLRLPFNSERLIKLTENYVVSNDKLTNVIKKPLPVSSREGLKKTIESFERPDS